MRTKLLLPAIILCAAACFAQTSQIPDTPAGRQFSAWLGALNAGPEKLRAFIEQNYPERLPHFEDAAQFQKMTGGFTLKKIESSSDTSLTAVMQERNSDQYARCVFEVEPAAPYHVKNISVDQIPPPAEAPPARMTQSAALAAFRAKLQEDSAAGRFSGAALVAKDGNPIFSEAYGLADREKKIPNTLDTKFRLGSMNKMFTATAVLQLVQAGKIQLDAPLGKYLPDYLNADIRNKVTIHQLLTHTGGTGDFFGPEYDAHRLEIRTLADYVKLFGSRGPGFEPGSRFEYSNYGFILLGRIVEVVSGQDYYDYVEKHIFLPAGMTSTNSTPEEIAVANRSIGYMKRGGADWQSNTSTLPYRGSSAGGGYSTVGDMLRFAQALTSFKLLNQHFAELLTTGKVDMGPNAKYAYGFGAVSAGGTRWFGHNG